MVVVTFIFASQSEHIVQPIKLFIIVINQYDLSVWLVFFSYWLGSQGVSPMYWLEQQSCLIILFKSAKRTFPILKVYVYKESKTQTRKYFTTYVILNIRANSFFFKNFHLIPSKFPKTSQNLTYSVLNIVCSDHEKCESNSFGDICIVKVLGFI